MRLNDRDKVRGILTAIEAAQGVPIPLGIAKKIALAYQELKAWDDSIKGD